MDKSLQDLKRKFPDIDSVENAFMVWEESQTTITGLREQIKVLESQVHNKNEEIDRLQNLIGQLQTHAGLLHAENIRLTQRLDNAIGAQSTLSVQLLELQAQNRALQAQNRALKKENEDLKNEISAWTTYGYVPDALCL